MAHSEKQDAYSKLRQKIEEIEKTGETKSLSEIGDILRRDIHINWGEIEQAERTRISREENSKIDVVRLDKNWKYHLIRSLATKREHGGDRKSIKARGAAQQAIVAHVEKQAIEAPDQMQTDEVEELCINSVSQRWRSPTQTGIVTMNRTVRELVRVVRGGNSGQVMQIMQQFEHIQIEEVKSVSAVAGIPLDRLTSMNPTILKSLIELRKAEVENETKIYDVEARKAEAQTKNIEAEAKVKQSENDTKARQAEAEAKVKQAEAQSNASIAESAVRQKEIETEVERTNAKVRLLEAQRQDEDAEPPKKRRVKQPVPNTEQKLEHAIQKLWNNRKSFSGECWQARPNDCPESIPEVMQRVFSWAEKLEHLYDIDYKLQNMKCGNVDLRLVYYNAKQNVSDWIHLFWEDLPVLIHGQPSNSPLPVGSSDLTKAVLEPLGLATA
jgi:hypothetical protein